MKKTILPVKKEVSFGHSEARAQRDINKGGAKATALGLNKPAMAHASRTVKGLSVVKQYKTSTLGK